MLSPGGNEFRRWDEASVVFYIIFLDTPVQVLFPVPLESCRLTAGSLVVGPGN